jgi:MFS family permease
MATLLLSAVPLSLAVGAVAPILPKISADLAHTPLQAYLVKMIAGIVGAAIVVGAPVAGLLVDRISHRSLFVTACLIFALMGFAPMMLDDLVLILGSRILMGIAAVTVSMVGATLVADAFSGSARSRWMGYITASAMAFALLGGVATGLLGDMGWRWGFLPYLIAAPIGALGCYAILPATSAGAGVKHVSASRPAFWQSLRMGLVVLAFMCGIIIYVPSVYIPFRLHELGLVKPSGIGVALTLSIVGSVAAASLFGSARQILSSRALFCCSFVGIGAGIAIAALAPTLPIVLAGLFVMGAGIGWTTPNLITAAFESVDESYRGRMLGIIRSAESLAPTLGVSAAELVAGSIGLRGVLLANVALAALLLVAVAAGGIMFRRRPPLPT